MPEPLEQALKRAAAAQGKTGREADHFVYGRMNNLGVMHGNKITAKGRAMEKKPRGRGRGSNNVTRKAR